MGYSLLSLEIAACKEKSRGTLLVWAKVPRDRGATIIRVDPGWEKRRAVMQQSMESTVNADLLSRPSCWKIRGSAIESSIDRSGNTGSFNRREQGHMALLSIERQSGSKGVTTSLA